MHKFIISGMLLIGLFYSVTIFAVKDRIIDKEIKSRLTDSVELALKIGSGLVMINFLPLSLIHI